MNNKLIIIDPSRGGEDIGNISNDIVEKDFNLEISKYIYNRLKELNIPVTIIRNTDETIDIPNRINKVKELSNEESILISNALTKGGNGVEIVYSIKNDITLAGLIAKELDRQEIKISKIYQRRLPRDINQDYNEIIRETPDSESIIIYYGSIDNKEDLKYLKNIDILGEAIVKAIANYLKIKYTPILTQYKEEIVYIL